MKIVLALLLFVALPATFAMFAEGINDVLHKIERECAKDIGVTMDEINMVRKTEIVPEMPNMMKWAKCMMMKHMVLMADGSVNMNPRTLKIPCDTDSIFKAHEKCRTKTGKDIEHTAMLMMNCYLQEHEMAMAMRDMKKFE